ncbi:MAG: carbon-nitrogen hydrolase family protein [Gemmatimonadota bacterium]
MPDGERVRVCGVQLAPELGRTAANAERVAHEIGLAAREGARLIVFPEAALTGYVFESRAEALAAAVHPDGPELAAVARACREAGAWAVCGAIERGGPAECGWADLDATLYNTLFLVGPAGLADRYRKIHTLCLGVDRFTVPGREPLQVEELPFGRVGLHICYDGSFPETGRALRLLGAQLLLLPTNWPDLRLKRELVQIRAYENHVNYFAVNRVGAERGVEFRGGSCAADVRGHLLLDAGSRPGRYAVEFDLSAADASHEIVSPGRYEYDRIADRRPDAYAPLVAPVSEAGRTGGRRSEE